MREWKHVEKREEAEENLKKMRLRTIIYKAYKDCKSSEEKESEKTASKKNEEEDYYRAKESDKEAERKTYAS